MVLSAAANDAVLRIAVRRIGPAMVFERLLSSPDEFSAKVGIEKSLAGTVARISGGFPR
jgi:hypothetical protein